MLCKKSKSKSAKTLTNLGNFTRMKHMIHTADLYKLDEQLRTQERKKVRKTPPSIPNSQPYTSPITDDVLVVLITKERANFSLYTPYSVSELDKIENQDEVIKHTKSESKAQQQKIDKLQKHFKEAAEMLSKIVNSEKIEYVVVLGHEEVVVKQFLNGIRSEIADKLIGSTAFSPDELNDNDTVVNFVAACLYDQQLQIEDKMADFLRQSKGEKRIITGLEQVLHALNRGMVTTLYLPDNVTQPGFFCEKDNNFSLEDLPCPICSQKMQKVPNIFATLRFEAAKVIKKVFVFYHKPEIMDEYDQAAAAVFMST